MRNFFWCPSLLSQVLPPSQLLLSSTATAPTPLLPTPSPTQPTCLCNQAEITPHRRVKPAWRVASAPLCWLNTVQKQLHSTMTPGRSTEAPQGQTDRQTAALATLFSPGFSPRPISIHKHKSVFFPQAASSEPPAWALLLAGCAAWPCPHTVLVPSGHRDPKEANTNCHRTPGITLTNLQISAENEKKRRNKRSQRKESARGTAPSGLGTREHSPRHR